MAFEIRNAISRCQQPLRLDEITRGDGNCFPRAVVQQCRRPEVHENIENNKKISTRDFMSLRNAVCNFMLNTNNPSVEHFRNSYIENEYQTSRISWNDYWYAMRRHMVWVDYKFIQATAWYLGHDIKILTTGSTPENPYILIEGSQGEDSIPSHHVPLLIGSQLDLHFQSLLPSSQVQELRVLKEAEFPPLQRKPIREKIGKFHGEKKEPHTKTKTKR